MHGVLASNRRLFKRRPCCDTECDESESLGNRGTIKAFLQVEI